jgi:hypothetical protein
MPGSPLDIIDGTIDELADLVTLSEAPGPTSHTAVIADGLDDRAAEALGRYLLGVLAGAVQLDARLSRKYMLSGASGHLEIVASVRRVVGETNVFDTITEKGFRDRTRNAWIGEGLAHALLVIRNRAETACLTGRVAAISKPHVIPSETGSTRSRSTTSTVSRSWPSASAKRVSPSRVGNLASPGVGPSSADAAPAAPRGRRLRRRRVRAPWHP